VRHYATSSKVAGSIPDEVTKFFYGLIPSSLTPSLGLNKPLTQISTRNLLEGKGRPAVKARKLAAICEPILSSRTPRFNFSSTLYPPDLLYTVYDLELTKLHGLSPRANYTDRATAASRRSDCQRLRIEGATWSA
jgi:hypothetical protein